MCPIFPHIIRVQNPHVWESLARSKFSNVFQAYGASESVNTERTRPSPSSGTWFPCSSFSNSDTNHNISLFCFVTKRSCAIQPGREIHSVNCWFSSPLDSQLTNVLLKLVLLSIIPRLTYLLIHAHQLSQPSQFWYPSLSRMKLMLCQRKATI